MSEFHLLDTMTQLEEQLMRMFMFARYGEIEAELAGCSICLDEAKTAIALVVEEAARVGKERALRWRSHTNPWVYDLAKTVEEEILRLKEDKP